MKMKDYFPLICRFYPKFDEELLFHAMEIFEVSESDKMGQMSYGQRKKALISLGIACNTRLLMMDEPTNGLDIPSKSQFRRLIASVASEPRITERFYRVDKGRSRDTGGTGLGLAIVKHVMRRAGGELSIESTPGEGSKFMLRFPEERIFSGRYL